MLTLTHTSPVEITKIEKHGLFNDCLFFSIDEYAMGNVEAVYTLNIEEDKIIDTAELDCDEVVADIALALDCTEDEAFDMLTSEIEAQDITGDCEDSWYIQAKQGEAAKLMGYEACESQDEQGAVYIVPMFERELDLVKK